MLTFKRLLAGAVAAAGLSALTLPAGADDYRGRDKGWDRGGGYGGAVLFADPGYSGEGVRIVGAEPDLKPLRFNDRASSISIDSGVWEVCVDPNFRGRCEVIDASASRLSTYRLNDNISSLRPVGYGDARGRDRGRNTGDWQGRRNGWNAALILYPDRGQRGQAIELSRDVPNLSDYRFNDRASSFFVSGGTWLACEHANYRGRCEVLTRGAGDLGQIRLNDNISSVRRLGDGEGYRASYGQGYGPDWRH